MSERNLHRREFLAQLGAGAASSLAFSAAGVLACRGDRDPLLGALEGLFADPAAARAIGAAWIAEQPTPPNTEELLAAIADGRIEPARALARSDPAALQAAHALGRTRILWLVKSAQPDHRANPLAATRVLQPVKPVWSRSADQADAGGNPQRFRLDGPHIRDVYPQPFGPRCGIDHRPFDDDRFRRQLDHRRRNSQLHRN